MATRGDRSPARGIDAGSANLSWVRCRMGSLKTWGVTLALSTMSVAATGQSSDVLMGNQVGSWKLNVAKSTYSPGPAPKSSIVKWEPSEGGLRMTADGVDAAGRPTHSEITIKFDGKDYPYKGAPAANTTRAYKRIDDRTYEYVEKTDGKVTTTERVVVRRDGKTRTST